MRRSILASLGAAIILLLAGVVTPRYALAASGSNTTGSGTGSASTAQSDICAGVSAVQGNGACSGNGTAAVGGIIRTVINVMSFFVGLVAVIMIIVGGFKYITSGGDSGKASNGRTTIVSALIGLVIVALAQVIVQFVLTNSNPARPPAKTTKG